MNDEMAQVNMNFNQDVNYKGLFHLEEALLNGRPEGLKELGNWPTIYEGLSDLPGQAQKSCSASTIFIRTILSTRHSKSYSATLPGLCLM